MSGAGRPEEGTVDAAGLRLGVVCTRWNGQVVEQAVQRSGGPGSTEDQGYEATVAALDAALVLGGLRHRPGRPPP